MKPINFLILGFFAISTSISAQSVQDLKDKRGLLRAEVAKRQIVVDSLKKSIAGVTKEIDIALGWVTGYAGNFGFDFNKSNNWQASPNEDASSSSLNIGLSAYANKVSEKTIWRNKGFFTKSWQDVDIQSPDSNEEKDNLFDNSTVDILNLSSLYGFKYSPKFGITGLAELNTSLESFLGTGSLDFGIGATWTPHNNLVVIAHPLNYHIGFSDQTGIETTGRIGAKVRVEYTRNIDVVGRKLTWSTTLTTFMPYSIKTITLLEDQSEPDGPTYEAGFFEYTWVNSLRFKVYKQIGVGIGFGLRDAEFESQEVQGYYSLGLGYSL